MTTTDPATPGHVPPRRPATPTDGQVDVGELWSLLRRNWKLCLGASLIAGFAGAGASYLIKPEFASTATFLPPQQQQSSAAAALASLGGLAGLGLGGVKSPAEQFVALMQSVTVGNRMIDQFKLMTVYDQQYRVRARKELSDHTTFTLGKKDGLINVEVQDTDPARAAAMANQYVEELRRMTSQLAISEAQQRRVFFEKQMQDTKAKLIAAQTVLQQSGINASDIQTEPQAAADQYARLRAQATAAEIQLQTLRTTLSESSPEVRQQTTLLQALRAKLEQLEASSKPDTAAPDYVSKYREFRYQETLFDLMAKQYELARIDESREGALIQVVDVAIPAELKSKPRRSLMAIGGALLGLLGSYAWVYFRAGQARRP